MLEGFDFSTGLSICHELESDSDDDNVLEKPWLPPVVSNEQQLTSALINVLGVGKEAGPGMTQAVSSSKIKAVTLDEIEEPVTKVNDTDQSAFNNLLAVMSPSHEVSLIVGKGLKLFWSAVEPARCTYPIVKGTCTFGFVVVISRFSVTD